MKLIARTMNEHHAIASDKQRALMQEQRSAIQQMVENVASITPPEYHFESVPRCMGTGPDLENWLARIGRVKVDHNLDDKLVIREAGAKLDGLAATWPDRVGKYFDTWGTWVDRFREASNCVLVLNSGFTLLRCAVNNPASRLPFMSSISLNTLSSARTLCRKRTSYRF